MSQVRIEDLFGGGAASNSDTVKVGWGSQSFDTTSSKVTIFAFDEGRRVFPSAVLRELPGSRRNIYAAADGGSHNGEWFVSGFRAEEGRLIMLTSTVTVNRARYADGCILLSLRNTGPLLSVDVILGQHRRATFDKMRVFEGRADLISAAEAQSRHGATFTGGFLATAFNSDELAELYDIRELAPELADKPELVEVRTSGGKVQTVSIPKAPGRVVRVRRPK